MQTILNSIKKNWVFIILIVLAIPSFYRMLRPGIFSMMDFPVFRQIEYNKCVASLELPCRWAPDSAMGYGEPVFNFYGQFTFFIGNLIHIVGLSVVDSVKAVFILSLVGSAVTMYLLAKQVWKNNNAALISAIIYLYAPYRSLDVWARGAYPESFAFLLFPLIILFLDRYFENKKTRDLLYYSLFLGLLVITHNLSLFMFVPFLGIWTLYRVIEEKNIKLILFVGLASFFGAMLSAFYLLPVLFEIKLINIQPIITGYFYFAGHFPTLHEIFISRFWGYGASLWGPKDDLSLSLGQIQWILPTVIVVLILVRKSVKNNIKFFVLALIGMTYIFLMHNKSTFIWNHIPVMEFIQFPWRFLGEAVFSFALASGAIFGVVSKRFWLLTTILIEITALVLNIGFFREDKWNNNTDKTYLSGWEWDLDRSASKEDYWPIYGPLPVNHPEEDLSLPIAEVSKSNYFKYKIIVSAPQKEVIFPVTYFPGWTAKVDGNPVKLTYNDKGYIKLNLNSGVHSVDLRFKNTPIRMLGNTISLISALVLLTLINKNKIWKEKT